MTKLFRLLLILSALATTACTLGGKAQPLTLIDPRVGPVETAGLTAVDWSVEIPRPLTDQTRDSDRLIVRRDSARLQVYPGVSWLDSLPDMAQTLMVQALTDSDLFAGVGREGLSARYALATELRRFELVDEGGDLRVELVITANLIGKRQRASAGFRTFRISEPVASSGLGPTVTAFEAALAQWLAELVPWILETGSAAIERHGDTAADQ